MVLARVALLVVLSIVPLVWPASAVAADGTAGEPPSSRSGELLYNGIQLPAEWPPRIARLTDEPMPVPYLEHPPEVVPIDLGRQLFVDDFLIERTSLKRTFHSPQSHSASPVLRPETAWERSAAGGSAAPFSGGVWFDPHEQCFRMWYQATEQRTCLALSADGVVWMRPALDVVPPTNVVLPAQGRISTRDANTIWPDWDAPDPQRRFKLFETRTAHSPFRMALRTSGDGIHWSEERALSAPSWDRSTVFYNPFRRVWVASVRGHDHVKPEPVHRVRCYFEAQSAESVLGWQQDCDEVAKGHALPRDLQLWTGADRLDVRNPDPRFAHLKPQLYNLDAFPYESLLVGLFTIWQGPTNEACRELGIPKRNEVFVAFTRDGFHWHRPHRVPFLGVSTDPHAWNAGNVQSVGGGCCIVGDQLYFYCSGRTMLPSPAISTGLATLRRDGFASLDAAAGGGAVTTRPVRFSGRHLFVNASPGNGMLRVEVLDRDAQLLPGFASDDCLPIRGDVTRGKVTWRSDRDLAALAGRVVRFRFLLTSGSLWSFWVTDDAHGASHGYVAAGGPGFSSSRDEPLEKIR